MKAPTFSELAEELEAVFTQGPGAPWPDGRFDELAMRCLEVQYAENPAYRAFCVSRGVDPAGLEHWWQAPAVPATAFKHLDLVTGSPESVSLVFRTSGTTRGPDTRGRHLVRRPSLYRASAVGNFAFNLLPDGVRPRLVSLIPSPEQAPESSLSAMVGMVAEELCADGRWVVDGRGALDLDGFLAEARGPEPLLVTGTALSFVHLLEALDDEHGISLPTGTRLMETGGFKGRTDGVSRAELYRRLEAGLGVPEERVVNEYGMTELLSQLYEPVLREGPGSPRRHLPPPWLAVRALDPVTLDEVPTGQEGILAFFDLANLGSVCHVLTEDVGSVSDAGVHLRGRVEGAEPRGCSRAMDDLMRAAGGRT